LKTPRNVAILATLGLALATAACSDDSKPDGRSSAAAGADAPVTIKVACQPAKTAAANRKAWDDDVRTFQAQHPNVTIKSTDQQPCFDPKTWGPKLAGGQTETVFVVPVTNYNEVIERRQALDITELTPLIKNFKDIRKDVTDLVTKDGRIYGVPNVNYGVGLVYNRKLFTQAGLDPANPPKTWAEVKEAAKKIAALGGQYTGYGEYGGGVVGGWHFTQALYSLGGSMVGPDGKSAAFNSPEGHAVLQNLKDMRWTDNSVGSKLNIGWEALMRQMATGKTGMMMGAADVITDVVQKFGGKVTDYAITGIPEGKSSLAGGEAYMINRTATPAEAKAGMEWIDFEFNTPGQGRFDFARGKAIGNPVGVPDNDYMGTSPTGEKIIADRKANATLPVENFELYSAAAATVKPKPEPPKAQELYAILDTAMSAVLTRKDADIDKLLTDAETKANAILAKG
jgi:multiple sugar transport system substrate-binding protein